MLYTSFRSKISNRGGPGGLTHMDCRAPVTTPNSLTVRTAVSHPGETQYDSNYILHTLIERSCHY